MKEDWFVRHVDALFQDIWKTSTDNDCPYYKMCFSSIKVHKFCYSIIFDLKAINKYC